jgi:hypothetical protein
MEQKQDILIGRDAEKKHLESIVLSKEADELCSSSSERERARAKLKVVMEAEGHKCH